MTDPKTQLKMMLFMLLSVITGSMGLVIYALDDSITLSHKVVGTLLIVSCVGHLITFYKIIKNGK